MLTALWKNPHKIFILSCSSKLDSYSSNKPQRRLLRSLSQRHSQTFLQAFLYSALPSAKISAPPSSLLLLAYLCASGITIGEVKVSKCIHPRSCFNGKGEEYICYSKCKEWWGFVCVCVCRCHQMSTSHLGRGERSKMFSNQKVMARPWTLRHALLS